MVARAFRSTRPLLLSGAFLVLLALVPLFVTSSYWLHVGVLALIYVVVVASWDLITGYAGIFSFGQIAFFAGGAYASGILAKSLGISPWLGLLLGGMIGAVMGCAIALPCLRVRGVYIAVVTYALHLLMPTIILRGEAFGTGGTKGLLGIPGFTLGDYRFSPLDKRPHYYAALLLAALSLYIIYFRVIRSNFGLGLVALRDSEHFAKSLGVNEYRTKILVFATSAFFTAVAGGFYAHYTGSVSQKILGLDLFLLILIMLTIGGMGRYPGAVIGTFVFAIANELLRVSGSMRQIIVGGIVILAILLMPQGLVQGVDSIAGAWRWRRWSGRALLRKGDDGAGRTGQFQGKKESSPLVGAQAGQAASSSEGEDGKSAVR